MPKPKPRRVGNPNNQTVKAFRGVSAEVLRAKRLAGNTPAGQSERVVSYDPAAVRAAIEAQICPFCGAGPYKMVAAHTVQAHGVDKRELRNLAGLLVSDSICSPETARKSREHALRTGAVVNAVEAARRGRKPRTWTDAGKEKSENARAAAVQKRVGNLAEDAASMVARFAALGGTVEAIEALAEERGVDRKAMRQFLVVHGCSVPDARIPSNQRRRRITDADRDEMVRLYGTGLSQSQIAEQIGTGQAYVSKILREAGAATRPFHRHSRPTSA